MLFNFVLIAVCGPKTKGQSLEDCRSTANQELGLQRMRDAGAALVSRGMVLFELLHSVSHEKFHQMSKAYLVSEQP